MSVTVQEVADLGGARNRIGIAKLDQRLAIARLEQQIARQPPVAPPNAEPFQQHLDRPRHLVASARGQCRGRHGTAARSGCRSRAAASRAAAARAAGTACVIDTSGALDIGVEIVHEHRVEQVAAERAEARIDRLGLLGLKRLGVTDTDDKDAVGATVNRRAQRRCQAQRSVAIKFIAYALRFEDKRQRRGSQQVLDLETHGNAVTAHAHPFLQAFHSLKEGDGARPFVGRRRDADRAQGALRNRVVEAVEIDPAA